MKLEDKDLSARIAAHPFLAGLTPHHIELLAASASIAQFAAGQEIFRAGDEAGGFYLIESGQANLEGAIADKPHVQIDIVSAGEPLGWSWLFPPYLWHYDARAAKPTSAIFFDRATFREFCDNDLTLGHELYKRMSKVMVRRLQASRTKMIDMLHKSD
jgi:CRP/FNR family cyclic AMP-dependent transcriptional regulator